MKNLHIIMPMAGEGRRFKDNGYDIPKPLIKVNDIELYRKALNSIESYITWNWTIKHTFIVRNEFITDYNIDEQIKQYYPNANIVSVEKTTRGALETALLAEPYIDTVNDLIMIMDCDMEFECQTYIDKLYDEYTFEGNEEPMLLSFYSHDPRYSYAECDYTEDGYVYMATQTAEKNPISTHALAGCYYFGLASDFVEYAHDLINDFENGKIADKEIYVSLLYNYYFKKYIIIQTIDFNQHTDKFISYGTPEEMEFSLHNKYNNVWDKK